ncbi:glycosyl transferase [Flavobacterium noncentrifugens]|uniref:Glycosyltransferase involved in cell wall bisynthesis n=1 Tax=Flavobacterium noncentrifugens TaxID=1128970 RepID=A0A1G8VVQ7_9FLAO|nr:glycosyltransferase family A protein [Flavobacterium noncentrifugens]GEP50668.1 glycosyl transferase [Flavobacterium noncentrifugens]SDJ70046.1 Glycosyltransferase involved in cell wall bisynthesis [Flavobacterium noncentrifugens]
MPTFSIVVPCYNQEEYLQECLESVISQSFSDWECLVVDDGSTDLSVEIAAKYSAKDSRIIYFHQQNAGLSAARNAGIRRASGTYILPLDGDDKIGAEYLELALKVFQSNPETKLVYCKAWLFGEVDQYWALPEYDYLKLLFQNCIFCSSIYRKEDFIKTKGYDENMKIGYEDWDFLIQLLNKEDRVFQIDSIQFFYRQRPKSMITFISDEEKHQNVIGYIYKKHQQKYFDAIGFDNSLEGVKAFHLKTENVNKFAHTFTYKTFFKIEREWDRLIKKFK